MAAVVKKRGVNPLKEPSVGCNGSLSLIEMIDLCIELESLHSGKMFLPEVEAHLKLFEQEQWIVPKIENDDNNDGKDDELSPKK